MKNPLTPGFVAGLAITAFLLPTPEAGRHADRDPQSSVQDPQPTGQDPQAEMKAMLEKAKRYTEPGKAHELLSRFLGKWSTQTRMFMGARATPPESGSAEFSWLIEGRWLQSKSDGAFMGRPARGFSILGYDNFKQSYVSTTVQSLDTAMLRAEGDLDPGGKSLIMYGTLDEYLTGEHDKMVKYLWRFTSEDEMVLEIHDLPIGEHNTKVLEISYTRAT